MLVFLLLAIATGAKAPVPETLIQLQVSPMAAPRPALRYLLLPELKELTPGNPIAAYLRCAPEQDFTDDKVPLSRSQLQQVDRAARMDKPDWQVLDKARIEGIGLLIPDVNTVRSLASKIKDRMRAEVAEGRFEDALASAKTLFAMSRHMSEHPTVIGNLIGINIASLAIGGLEELIGQPGSPNLYWALTNLPTPLVSCQTGLEGDRLLLQGVLRQYVSDSTALNGADLHKRIDHLLKAQNFEKQSDPQKIQEWWDARLKEPLWVVQARTRLVDYGIPEERLLKFPIEQIILLDEKREFEAQRDEYMKLMNLPTWQLEEQLLELKKPAKKPLFGDLFSAYNNIRRAQGRLEQRIALLRHVEAMRLYAADHGAKLPERLADIHLPLPVDPVTGKPFRYALAGATGHLRGDPPHGAENVSANNVHYEIGIRK